MPEYIPSPTEWVRKQVEQIEASGGKEGMTLRDMAVVLVTSTGARTGAIRKTPLMRVKVGDTYILVASKGGAPEHPVWYYNLLKTPEVLLRDGEVERPMRARLVTDDAERTRLWAAAVESFPNYAEYQTKTTRQIPVFAVEPV